MTDTRALHFASAAMSPEGRFGEHSVRGGLVTTSWKVLGNFLTVNIRVDEIDICHVLAVLENRDVT